jgi:hemerythrin-like domain-containing protein
MKVGYIEDVSVKKGYEGIRIGKQIVDYVTNYAKTIHHCKKILLYCSERNKIF